MIVMAFDFGTRCIGVAVGDAQSHGIRPLPSLGARAGHPEWNDVDRLIADWRPHTLVVGLPLNMDGSYQRLSRMAQAFADQLEKRYCRDTVMVDERLTTQEARDRLFQQGGYRALQKSAVDGESACLILDQFLAEL